jgi:hypothetical protein
MSLEGRLLPTCKIQLVFPGLNGFSVYVSKKKEGVSENYTKFVLLE